MACSYERPVSGPKAADIPAGRPMLRPAPLRPGDRIAVVSLSRGLLGEASVRHERELGLRRLREFGLRPVLMPNAAAGSAFLAEHPEARAADLKAAFLDPSVRGILSAIGGNDTFRLYPYLLEDEEFCRAVRSDPKLFTGFSDTTMDHLLLYRLGLRTFYGPALLPDLAELDREMLPYTRAYFEKFFRCEDGFAVSSSPVWYESRADYGPESLGTGRPVHSETHGFELLNGGGIVSGTLYGGCIESLYDAMTGASLPEEPAICERYHIWPAAAEWRDILLFLETSETASSPALLETMLTEFKTRGILAAVRGVIVGKPMDERHYEAYRDVYRRVFADLATPVLYNLNFGHAVPRCVLPYGARAELDCGGRTLRVTEAMLRAE